MATGGGFVPREPPEDFATFAARAIRTYPSRYHGRFLVPSAVAAIRARVPEWLGMLEPHGETHTLVTMGGDSYDAIVGQLVLTGLEFTLLDPPEMAPALRAVAARLNRSPLRPARTGPQGKGSKQI